MTENKERRICCKVVEAKAEENLVTIKLQCADAKQAETCRQAVKRCGDALDDCLPNDCCQ